MIFVDCNCSTCSAFIQLRYNPKTDTLHGGDCPDCGATMSYTERDRIRHPLDALTSAFAHVSIEPQIATFLKD